MAVRGTEGFDHYAVFADAASRAGNLGWYTASSPAPTIVTPGRGGFGKCLSLPTLSNYLGATVAAFNANLATYFVGFAMLSSPVEGASPSAFSVGIYDPIGIGGVQCSVLFNLAAGQVTLYRGQEATELAASSPSVFAAGAWTFVEIECTVSSTVGVLSVRCNNQPVVSVTGANTQTTANATWGGASLAPLLGGGTQLIDDFRYNDTTTGPGTYPCNSWLGDLRVATLFATANDDVTWTPLAETNWEEVSETAFDGDTSYNSTSTLGDEDLFNMGTLDAVIDEIVAVQIVGGYREADAGAHTFTQQLKIGGVDNAGAVQTLAPSYQFFSDLFPVNPTTGVSWSLSDVNSMLVGYKAVS